MYLPFQDCTLIKSDGKHIFGCVSKYNLLGIHTYVITYRQVVNKQKLYQKGRRVSTTLHHSLKIVSVYRSITSVYPMKSQQVERVEHAFPAKCIWSTAQLPNDDYVHCTKQGFALPHTTIHCEQNIVSKNGKFWTLISNYT